MTPFKENVTKSIDNLNSLESDVKDLQDYDIDDLQELIAKIDYIYRLAGGN